MFDFKKSKCSYILKGREYFHWTITEAPSQVVVNCGYVQDFLDAWGGKNNLGFILDASQRHPRWGQLSPNKLLLCSCLCYRYVLATCNRIAWNFVQPLYCMPFTSALILVSHRVLGNGNPLAGRSLNYRRAGWLDDQKRFNRWRCSWQWGWEGP
jgi:hypothetical protein